MPLPPYITTALEDPERYQTVYAAQPGSVAAPTAGLHLTARVLDGVRAAGPWCAASIWSSASARSGPITTEQGRGPPDARRALPRARGHAGRLRAADRVVAIGTTTVRALESAAATGSLEGRTDLFIHGARPFAVVDALLTNFHQPRSSLLVLVEAFVGPRWRALYEEALREGYRFLSFGDAMLLAGRRGCR